MALAKIIDGAVALYPYSHAELRADHPGTSFPEDLSEADLSDFGIVEIADTAAPDVDADHTAEEGAPALTDGAWRRTWTIRARTSDELAAAKLARWAEAKMNRDAAIDAGCTVANIGRFDSDPASRNNITGAVVGAMIAKSAAAPFSIGWKLQDNSLAVLDGLQMIAVGMAVMTRVASCHAQAQAIGSAIEAAADFAALGAIDITTGWPG